MRLSDEQRNLLKGMKLLIQLYYEIKPLTGNDLYSGRCIRMLHQVLYLTIPSFAPAVYVEEQPRFHYGPKAEISISDHDWERFIHLMTTFRDRIMDDSLRDIFHIEDVSLIKRVIIKKDKPIEKFQFEKTYPLYKAKRIPNYKIVLVRPYDMGPLRSYPDYEEIFRLDVDPESNLFEAFYTGSQLQEETYSVKTPAFKGSISLHEAIQYIVSKFYTHFGSFERLKVCRYCQRIFLEERSGRGLFCSTQCKQEFHRKSDTEILKCRNRQNQWIRSQIDFNKKLRRIADQLKPITIVKSDCIKCSGPVAKKMRCPILERKNTRIFNLLI